MQKQASKWVVLSAIFLGFLPGTSYAMPSLEGGSDSESVEGVLSESDDFSDIGNNESGTWSEVSSNAGRTFELLIDDADEFMRQGLAFRGNKQFEDAILALSLSFRQDPQPEALLELSIAYQLYSESLGSVQPQKASWASLRAEFFKNYANEILGSESSGTSRITTVEKKDFKRFTKWAEVLEVINADSPGSNDFLEFSKHLLVSGRTISESLKEISNRIEEVFSGEKNYEEVVQMTSRYLEYLKEAQKFENLKTIQSELIKFEAQFGANFFEYAKEQLLRFQSEAVAKLRQVEEAEVGPELKIRTPEVQADPVLALTSPRENGQAISDLMRLFPLW